MKAQDDSASLISTSGIPGELSGERESLRKRRNVPVTSYSFDDEKCSIYQTWVGAGHFVYFGVPSRPEMPTDEINFIRNPSAYGLEQLTQREYRDGAMILQRDPNLTVNALFWDHQITGC